MNIRKTGLILGIVVLWISGCAGEPSAELIEISCDEFTQKESISDSLIMDAGQEITIKLCSNPSTGFEWSETPENTHPSILFQAGHEFLIQNENGTPLPPGTPGQQVWTFSAVSAGQSQLYFEYSRNWEGGEKGVWTYRPEVTVQ